MSAYSIENSNEKIEKRSRKEDKIPLSTSTSSLISKTTDLQLQLETSTVPKALMNWYEEGTKKLYAGKSPEEKAKIDLATQLFNFAQMVYNYVESTRDPASRVFIGSDTEPYFVTFKRLMDAHGLEKDQETTMFDILEDYHHQLQSAGFAGLPFQFKTEGGKTYAEMKIPSVMHHDMCDLRKTYFEQIKK